MKAERVLTVGLRSTTATFSLGFFRLFALPLAFITPGGISFSKESFALIMFLEELRHSVRQLTRRSSIGVRRRVFRFGRFRSTMMLIVVSRNQVQVSNRNLRHLAARWLVPKKL